MQESITTPESEQEAPLQKNGFDSFEEVMIRHQREIYGYILRMTNREDVADDLTQDTFVEAWKHLAALRYKAAIRSWLFKIAINKVRSYGRWKRLRNFLSLDHRV